MGTTGASGVTAKAKGRPKKPGGEGVPVRIDSDIVRKLRIICSLKEAPLSDFASDLLRPLVEKEFRKAAKEIQDEGQRDPK